MKNKKILFIAIVSIVTLVLIGLIIFIFIKPVKDIKYSCGMAAKNPFYSVTDIIYVTKTKNKIIKQNVTALYYNDKEEYLKDKQRANGNDKAFNDEKLTIVVTGKKEEVKDKKLEVLLEEIEKNNYKCELMKEQGK